MLQAERRRVADAIGELAARTPGRSGNLSVRRADRFAITPTGIPYETVTPDDIAVVDRDGGEHLAGLSPSSETPMHALIYREIQPGAILHTHAPWPTTLAVLRTPIPPVHYLLAKAGPAVPVADYATYGTEALGRNAVSALRSTSGRACLLANHGLLVTGEDLETVFDAHDQVAFTARLYVTAASIGDPAILSATEMDRVGARLADTEESQ